MALELEKRAAMEHDGEVLDYAAEWVGDGGTLVSLAADITKTLGFHISRPMLSKHLNGLKDGATDTLSRAREDGAHAIVERLRGIVEDTPATRDDIARTKLQMDMDLWLVERWNKRDYGQAKQPGVSVTIGTLVLESLRSPAPELEVATVIAGVIAPADEVVSDVTIEG